MLVQHHIKYIEIHGVDEVVMMEKGEHDKLHKRLRSVGKCSMTAVELDRISKRAHQRSKLGMATTAKWRKENWQQILEYTPIGPGISLAERIAYNFNNGNVGYASWFTCQSKGKITYIDI